MKNPAGTKNTALLDVGEEVSEMGDRWNYVGNAAWNMKFREAIRNSAPQVVVKLRLVTSLIVSRRLFARPAGMKDYRPSAGITAYFKFRERSMNLRQTADAMDQEMQALILTIRRYKGKNPRAAEVEFAEEIERLKEDQRKREQQVPIDCFRESTRRGTSHVAF
ncbi:hypothetical protein [Nocardia concava]|uniref:hypothetical protein n=1 Tax=Nocardia concava TaxID=257281 RepID=UPI0012F9A9BC|nr:hypothetical protein [Nocardia concava]